LYDVEISMQKVRTFVAVEMPEQVRAQFRDVEAQLRQADAHVKWVEPHNIHMTLKFLGDVTEDELDRLYRGVDEGAQKCAPFEISLSQLGAFPHLRRPRVVWIGIERGKEPLVQLHKRLEDSISGQGFPKENRKFSPHLTIGRVKSPRGIDDLVEAIQATPFESESFEINEVVVMESTLTPEGPIYTPLRRVGLTK
jgi:2'-5' RNA ligase